MLSFLQSHCLTLIFQGALYLNRFGSGEDIPCWKDIHHFFERYTICQYANPTKPANYNVVNACFKRLFHAIKATCKKVCVYMCVCMS